MTKYKILCCFFYINNIIVFGQKITDDKVIKLFNEAKKNNAIEQSIPSYENALKLAKEGKIAFDFGKYWMKGQSMATGQANVKAYNRKLRNLIAEDKAKPSFIISHELPLSKAKEAYGHFDARDDGWTKVILKP